jgi:uncharacterized protein (TIGR03790 family)
VLVGFVTTAGALRAADEAARVIILANRDDPDSVRLAHYYAEKRAVPVENILSFPMPRSETINREEFVTTIWQPLEDELIRRQWLDGVGTTLTDGLGRRKVAVHGHHISYLVVCRGVPLRIFHNPAWLEQDPNAKKLQVELHTNQAGVDSELALLPMGNPAISAFVPNPLFRNDHPSAVDLNRVLKITRLDGPSYAIAAGLVDLALAAEQSGLLGRAYVDLNGLNPTGDVWLESVVAQLTVLGFDLDADRLPTTFPATARMDAPVLYFGWYAGSLNGPLALPGFRFAPGAVAMHIHSYSAATLNSPTEGWCGPLLARGATATVGNVFEPYLEFTHQPDLLLRAFARGATFGDAAAYAIRFLSWQGVAIGDPLFRPFAVPLDVQLTNRARRPAPGSGYAVLRKAHLLENAKRAPEAMTLLRQTAREDPSLAVAVALADRLEAVRGKAEAVQVLSAAPLPAKIRPDEWALVRLIAQRLQHAGAPGAAVKVYQALFSDEDLPRELRAAWLHEAAETAASARDASQAAAWLDELSALAPAGTK